MNGTLCQLTKQPFRIINGVSVRGKYYGFRAQSKEASEERRGIGGGGERGLRGRGSRGGGLSGECKRTWKKRYYRTTWRRKEENSEENVDRN